MRLSILLLGIGCSFLAGINRNKLEGEIWLAATVIVCCIMAAVLVLEKAIENKNKP